MTSAQKPNVYPWQRRCRRHAGLAAHPAGEDARQVVADAGREEPTAHAEADQTHRCELGHHREPDRRQAQLAHGLDDVDREQGPERNLAGRGHHARECHHQHHEGEAVEDEPESEFARDGRIRFAHLDPHPCCNRCQHDDAERVDRLEPRIREHEAARAEEVTIHDLIGQERERTARLLEEHPKQDVKGEDDQHRDGAVALDLPLAHAFHQNHHAQHDEHRGQQPLQSVGADRQEEVDHWNHDQRAESDVEHLAAPAAVRLRRTADPLQLPAAEPEPHHADQHADTGRDEHDFVGRHRLAAEDTVREPSGQNGCDERTGVDAHVEDGESRIAARIAYRIELSDHRRDVGFEQTVARDDGGEPKLEDRVVRHRDHEQAGRHDHRTQQNRTLVAEDAVGRVAAEDRGRVHKGQVCAVNQIRRRLTRLVAAVELRDHVQHQRPAHAVEGEALPKLGHEEHPQRTWMAEDLLELGDRGRPGRRGSTAHAVLLPLVNRVGISFGNSGESNRWVDTASSVRGCVAGRSALRCVPLDRAHFIPFGGYP